MSLVYDGNKVFTNVSLGSVRGEGTVGAYRLLFRFEVSGTGAPEGTMIVTHCNGSSGYICTDKSFPEGGYEVKVTRLMPGIEKPLTLKVLELIHSF